MLGAGGLIGSAKLLIALLYDPRYHAATPMLQLIAISSALYIVVASSEEALIASGRTSWTLYGNIARITWLAVGGAVAIATGNVMLLVAVVGTREVAAALCAWVGLRRAHLFDIREEMLGLGVLGIGAVVGYGIATGILSVLPTL
jgi:O-antigen/teichoic acid export membrane protein